MQSRPFRADLWLVIAALCALLLPAMAHAQPAPVASGDAQIPYLVEMIGRGFAEKNWLLVAGAALMLLTVLGGWLLRVAKDRPGLKALLPWLTVILGVLASIGTALLSGQEALPSIIGGLTVGAAGVGLWELVGKKVAKLFSPARREETKIKAAAVAGFKAGSLQLQPDGSIKLSQPPSHLPTPSYASRR